jgi:ABC-type enterobactin transport system permease subunit
MKPLTPRLLTTIILLIAAAVGLGGWSLGSGAVPLSGIQVFEALFGNAPRGITLVVVEWRLPRVLSALLVGAALGVSGAIFQSLLRNPLGSPDVMGFNTGAWSGVLLAMVLFNQQATTVAFAAMGGGILCSFVVWLLAWRNGIDTFRLIIIGIGVRAMLMAFNTWLLLHASLDTAVSAGLWNAGSLNGLTWSKLFPGAPLIVVILAAAGILARRMRLLEMGDDTACALGVRVELSRMLLILTAVLLTACATALAGPFLLWRWLRRILRAASAARRAGGCAVGIVRRRAAAACGFMRSAPVYALPVAGRRCYRQHGGLYLIALLIKESRKR